MKTTITFILLTMFVFCKAQDGTLDPTFGTNGITGKNSKGEMISGKIIKN